MDDITIVNSQMASLMQQQMRPPLPPAARSPMNVRQDDLIQLRQKHKLKMTAKYCDVAVIYSSRCQVSGEWARFISALMKQQGYQNVVSQCIESEFLGKQSLFAIRTYFSMKSLQMIMPTHPKSFKLKRKSWYLANHFSTGYTSILVPTLAHR